MTYIVTSLCLRDLSCVPICPTGAIVMGDPAAGWPWAYVSPKLCIDCDACVKHCPVHAIFLDDDVPSAYVAQAGQRLNAPRHPDLQARATGHFEGVDVYNRPVVLDHIVTLAEGEVVDLTPDIQPNLEFFLAGPGAPPKEVE